MTMLPREQVVTVALDTGLDTGADPQVATAMAVASNVTYPRRGAVAKRAGQARSAATVGAALAPSRLARLGTSAVVHGGIGATLYAPGSDIQAPVTYDTTERAMETRIRPIGDTATLTATIVSAMFSPSLAMGDSVIAVAYNGTLITYTRADLTPIDYLAIGATTTRLVRLSDGQIAAILGGAGGISARVISTSGAIGAATVMSATAVDTLTVSLVGSDVYVLARGTSVGIVLGRMAGGSPGSWSEAIVDAIGGVVSLGPGLSTLGVTSGVLIAWSRRIGSSDYVAAEVRDSSLAVVTSRATVLAAGGTHPQHMASVHGARSGAPAGAIASVYAAGSMGTATPAVVTDRRVCCEYVYTDTAGVGGFAYSAQRTTYGATLAAAPMQYGAAEWYVPFYSESWGATYPDASSHQGMIVVSGCGDFALGTSSITAASLYRPVAIVGHQYARQPVGTVAPMPSDSVRRSTSDVTQGWAFLAQYAVRDVPGTQRGDVISLRLVEVWPDAQYGAAVEHGGASLLPGALPRECDGSSVYEQGWIQYPEPIVHASSSAGLLTPGATYQYAATYESIDALGRRHMSAPTPLPISITPAGASTALPTLHIGTLAHSLRGRRTFTSGSRRSYGSAVNVVIWRTLANGSIFYRCVDTPQDYTVAYTSITLGLDLPDATIAVNEIMPTTGGILASAPPPPYVAQTMWQGRHVVVDADRQELRYSRATAVGAPIQHALELAQPLRLDGTVTALDAIGGRLIIMTDRAIYATDGTGYDDIGQGQPLADPYLISSLVGCSDARSVARLPQGIAFLGGSRIWLLDSGLALQPIGEPVRYYTASHTYRDAVPLQTRTSVAWTSATGPALVYDAVHGRWSTWDTHACVGACASSTGMLRLASDYRVWRPAADTAGDDGAWVTMDLATGWLAIADWQRVAEIEVSGYYVSRCAIRMRVQYDYVPVDVDDVTYTPAANGLLVSPSSDHWGAGLGAGYLDRALRISHAPSRTQCSALRVRITDAREGSEALGAGAEWATVRVRLQAEAGVQRLDRSRRTG